MPTGALPLSNHQPGIVSEPNDVNTINPALNTDLEENSPQWEGIIGEYYERPAKGIPAEVSWTANSDRWSKDG